MTISYSHRDYEEIKKQLLEKIPEIDEMDRWTDLSEADLGVIIIDLISAVGDLISYILDRQAMEVYLESATEERNVRAALELIGYTLHHYRASRVDIEVRSLVTEELDIPMYHHFATEEDVDGNPIYFVTDNDYVINQSDGVNYSSTTVTLIQGVHGHEEKNYEDIFRENRLLLSDEPIAEESVTLKVNNLEWEEVEDVFLMEQNLGQFYHVETDNNGNLVLVLTPRWQNVVPNSSNANFSIDYVYTLGNRGTIGPRKITEISDPVYNGQGEDVSDDLVIIQLEPSRGGTDPETIESARDEGPRRARSTWTAITKIDYKVLAESVAGVHKAKALDLNDEGYGITEPYIVDLVIVPDELDTATSALRTQVYDFLFPRRVGTIQVNLIDPDYIDVDVDVEVELRPGYPYKVQVEEDLKKVVEDYLSEADFEYSIFRAELYRRMMESSRFIRNLKINLPEEDIIPEMIQFTRLNSLNITFK